jgi:hypothetical protein
MLPLKVPNSTMVYKGPTPDIGDLACQRIAPGHIRSIWTLTDEERAYIAAGGNLELDIFTEPIPPVSLNCSDEGAEFKPDAAVVEDVPVRTWSRNYLYGRSRANRWPLWISWLLAPTPAARQTCRELIELRRRGVDV